MNAKLPQFAKPHPELDLLTGHGLAQFPSEVVCCGCCATLIAPFYEVAGTEGIGR
jgi:hypothetical protein